MNDYVIEVKDDRYFDLQNVSRQVYKLVCRTDFTQPGFALIKLSPQETSKGQRRKMVDLKNCLSDLLFDKTNERLEWFNMTRFDQKNTTKPHRDGAPLDSLLMLGYEPTKVASDITMADYSRCAYEHGLTPEQFLEDFNPMYERGLEILAEYTTQIKEFEPELFQLLLINNSANPLSPDQLKWQGVLHSATVSNDDGPRVINSTCLAPASHAVFEAVGADKVAEFLDSETISGSYQ